MAPSVEGNTVAFTLPGAAYLTVEINGEQAGARHLFAEAPETEVPTGENVLYNGDGLCETDTITLTGGQTACLSAGAVVLGRFVAEGVENIRICGHGVIDDSGFDHWEQPSVPLDFSSHRNVSVTGVTLLAPAAWALNLYRRGDVTVKNVKIISARSNSDDIIVRSCKRVVVDGCFARGWDDNLVVKGCDGDAEDVAFTHCVLWTDLAPGCVIGYETRAGSFRNIRFENITVLHANHKPVCSIHDGDNAPVQNAVFRNVAVEDCRLGQGNGTEFLIDLTTTKSQWSKSKERGNIRDVLIENMAVLSGKVPAVRIIAFDREHTIDGITIRNLTLMGERITSFDQLRYTYSPRKLGENITIEQPAPPGVPPNR